MCDIKNKLENKSIKIHDIYLPRMKELCYDNNEIYLDFAMFMCTSFEEMEKYICGNKERKCVMENLKNFVLNENLPTYDYEEYLTALHKEVEEEARAEGLAKGLEQGIAQGLEKGIAQGRAEERKENILMLYENSVSKEQISKSLNISIDQIDEILKEAKEN